MRPFKMNDTLTLTIPLNRKMIINTIRFLNTVAHDLDSADVVPDPNTDEIPNLVKEVRESSVGEVPSANAEATATEVLPVDKTEGLDGAGYPWDERIHQSTKTRRQSDDTWTLKRNIDPAYVATVRAEYLNPPAAGQKTISSTLEPAQTEEVETSVGKTFADLMTLAQNKVQADTTGKFMERLTPVLIANGVAQLGDLISLPEKIQTIYIAIELL